MSPVIAPRTVYPVRFRFRATELAHWICNENELYGAYAPSIRQALAAGGDYSQAFGILVPAIAAANVGDELDLVDDANRAVNIVGQKYYGPTVLITNALTYSAADMFAVGFRDYVFDGQILGLDGNIGAGGANYWRHETLRRCLPDLVLDAAYADALKAGELSPDLRAEIERAGVILAPDAAVRSDKDYEGEFWQIGDPGGEVRARMTLEPNSRLAIYHGRGRSGIRDLPKGVSFGWPIRQAVRVGTAAGDLIEDFGLKVAAHIG